jgi:four helix bundle protein
MIKYTQMAIKSFKEIIAWQKSRELTRAVYDTFSSCTDYDFRDQIQRASISIMNNIAEGYAKQSNKGFKNFLLISKGSAAEVESMLIIAADLGYISVNQQQKLLEQTTEVSMLLSGFIRKM